MSEKHGVLMGTNTIMSAEAVDRERAMERESNKRGRESSPTQETAAKKTANEETS